MRRFSSLVSSSHISSSSSPSSIPEEGRIQDDKQSIFSKNTAVEKEEALPPPALKVKRVDYYYSRWTRSYKYRNMSSNVVVETIPIIGGGSNDIWKDFTFVLVRSLPKERNLDATFKVVIKSGYLLKACRDVIRSWPGISWNSDPLEMDPDIFIAFYPAFTKYAEDLTNKKARTIEETHVLSSVNLLISSIAADFRVTLTKINRLISHGEINFDLLYAILVPRTIMVGRCSITGLPRLFQLASWTRLTVEGKPVFQLNLESVDLVDRPITQSVVVGRVQSTVLLRPIKGTIKINTMDVYPIQFHPDIKGLKESILKRAKKWVSLIGMHHMQYEGIAATKMGEKVVKHNVRSRIMVDRATFRRQNPNQLLPVPVFPGTGENSDETVDPRFNQTAYDEYGNPIPHMPIPVLSDSIAQQSASDTSNVELTDDDLLLTPSTVYGFSLSDKVWLEFDVEKVKEVDWNTEAFSNLVLPGERKELLQSLVEAHHKEIGFDDFIKGKGHGLVVNLFGPPGVGKTFSAEATSEHVRRPLYIIGGGDLGTTATSLDTALEQIFDVATAWKAIVLIDEADVFLERRSLHDLERNAMVAVFLRHVEYYRGILFLTTNRVTAFDEAFLSRIHVALHFGELSTASKAQVWTAFIKKMGDAAQDFTEEQILDLAKRGINGRQIKNAARTAHSLAVGKGQKVGYDHLRLTLDSMDEFTREFERK